MMVFVGIVLAYGSTVVPMVKNVFCFIGVTAWCRQKSWERTDSPVRIESQSQADISSGQGGLKNFVVENTPVPVTPVPVTSGPGGLEVLVTSEPAIKTEITRLPVPIIIAITPTTQPLPDIPVPNTPSVPVFQPTSTQATLVDGYDLQGFTSLCSAMGSGFVVENQGGIYVCHCPGCP